MSHTYRYDDGTTFIANPDLSGDVVIMGRGGDVVVGGATLLAFLRAYQAREHAAIWESLMDGPEHTAQYRAYLGMSDDA